MNLMRSTLRILIAACFLLFVAWLSMKLMQYGGDWDKLFQEAQQKTAPFTDSAMRFINEQVLPRFEELAQTVQSFGGSQ